MIIKEYEVWSRETGQHFGVVRAWSEDSAISNVIGNAGVSPYDADPTLTARCKED